MKTFRDLCEEIKPHKAVSETGTGLSAHLIQQFGGEKHKNMMGSKSYAD